MGVVVMGVRKVCLHPNLMTQGASPRVKTPSTQNTPPRSLTSCVPSKSQK